jgi:hypothetical protein
VNTRALSLRNRRPTNHGNYRVFPSIRLKDRNYSFIRHIHTLSLSLSPCPLSKAAIATCTLRASSVSVFDGGLMHLFESPFPPLLISASVVAAICTYQKQVPTKLVLVTVLTKKYFHVPVLIQPVRMPENQSSGSSN